MSRTPTQTSNPLIISRLSTEDLRTHLSRAIQLTAEAIAYLAAVWVELERRGEDLSDVKIGLAPYLRDVAAGRVAPEAVLAFAGHRMVLRWVAKQPISEQVELARRKPVLIRDRNGTDRAVPATDLSILDLRQIMLPDDRTQDATARIRRGRGPQGKEKLRTAAVSLRISEYEDIARAAVASGTSVSDEMRRRLGLALIGGGAR